MSCSTGSRRCRTCSWLCRRAGKRGKCDLDGNLRALDLALGRLREEARQLQGSAAARCKTYVTLGVCTGLAVAVILI